MPSREDYTPADRPLLGEILLKRNLITKNQLEEALAIQKEKKRYLGEILIELGYIQEKDIVVALVVQCGLPFIAVSKYEIDRGILNLVPAEIARQFHVIPLDRVGNVLSVVMANPLSVEMREELQRITGCKIAAFISTRSEIDQAIGRCYRKD